jgi:toxin-antitoxin system PIN domain toxin
VSRYLLDVNVLIALAWPSHVHHTRARTWWATIHDWATTPVTESAFVRLSANANVVGQVVTVAESLDLLVAIRATPGHTFLSDETSLTRAAIDLGRVATSSQITDAHLVNLAAAHGAILATMDARIPDMLQPPDRPHVLVVPLA